VSDSFVSLASFVVLVDVDDRVRRWVSDGADNLPSSVVFVSSSGGEDCLSFDLSTDDFDGDDRSRDVMVTGSSKSETLRRCANSSTVDSPRFDGAGSESMANIDSSSSAATAGADSTNGFKV
jgi:hypothetical protein